MEHHWDTHGLEMNDTLQNTETSFKISMIKEIKQN